MRRALPFLSIASLLFVYDLWAVRSAGYPFLWGRRDLPGYYDYLGRAFAAGHLYLPIQPTPQLLALADPYDPAAGAEYKMHDMAYRNGRYYLYHGAAPAVLLFAPWRILTGRDLPENFALFVFCFLGWAFSAGALVALLDLAAVRPPPALLAALFLILGISPAVPYLMSRVWVYEIAIGGAYCCTMAALWTLLRGVESPHRARWWAASGLIFGLAVACRPHMLFAAAIALAVIVLRRTPRPHLVAFAAPLAAAGVLIGAYNYARFDNPFEFGIRYLLSGADQNRIHLDPAYLPHGIYYFLACAPDFMRAFPWVHVVSRHASLPPGYFLEPTAGAFFFAPFLIAALAVPNTKARPWTWMLAATSLAILLFLAATGFTTERYLVDFLPLAVLAALANIAIHLHRMRRPARVLLAAAFTAAALYSAVVNLALGIRGPYDEMLRNRPQTWLRIASLFPGAPQFALDVTAAPGPIFAIGSRYQLTAEPIPTGLRVTSRTPAGTTIRDVPPGATLHLTYTAGRLTIE